jgi:peptide/nickel transport system substrate-binding protein
MKRRSFLKLAAAGAAGSLAAPHVAGAQDRKVLKFIPQSDLAILDPIWTTAYVTRNHSYMVFDTLFSTDGSFKASPQMAEGLTTENDARRAEMA